MGNRLAILEPPPVEKPSEVTVFVGSLASSDTDGAAFTTVYYPWLTVPGLDRANRTVPPCGHVVGVWARNDAERGVFKAPANQNLRGVLSVPTVLTDQQNGDLNSTGVNCLHVFPVIDTDTDTDGYIAWDDFQRIPRPRRRGRRRLRAPSRTVGTASRTVT